MVTGYNTDVPYEGKVYHVQTEDKGLKNPLIESLVYVGGEILAARRTSYAELVHRGRCDEKEVARVLEAQHRQLIREIREGRHDPEGLKPIGEGLITDRSLDEVVLDYIGELLRAEQLELTPLSEAGLAAGGTCRIQLLARGNLTGRPIREAEVEFRLEGAGEAPRVLGRERTGADGIVRARFDLPAGPAAGKALVAELVEPAGGARWRGAIRAAGPAA